MRLKLNGQIKERPLISFSGNVTFEAAVVKKKQHYLDIENEEEYF